MFSRFTASARRVMQRAFREAKRWQHDFVGTEHLLYGLLCDADGPAVVLLRSLDARPELMLQKVELSLQRHDGGMALEQFPLSPASRRVFRGAADEAELFRHQMIGPEHLLLGLLREADCEAAQILGAHGVVFGAARNAVAQLSPDAYQEAQIQANETPRVAPPDNPSADELERWIAPPITVEQESDPLSRVMPIAEQPANALQDVEAQVRRTQVVLGAVLGFTFGYWLSGWMLGALSALAWVGIACCRNSWIGIVCGVGCGLFIVPMFYHDPANPLYPVLMGLLGGFLGSFLGDGWRFSWVVPVQQPPPAQPQDPEKAHDAAEDRQRNGIRSRQ